MDRKSKDCELSYQIKLLMSFFKEVQRAMGYTRALEDQSFYESFEAAQLHPLPPHCRTKNRPPWKDKDFFGEQLKFTLAAGPTTQKSNWPGCPATFTMYFYSVDTSKNLQAVTCVLNLSKSRYMMNPVLWKAYLFTFFPFRNDTSLLQK